MTDRKKRRFDRKTFERMVALDLGDGSASTSCEIMDISDGGARLRPLHVYAESSAGEIHAVVVGLRQGSSQLPGDLAIDQPTRRAIPRSLKILQRRSGAAIRSLRQPLKQSERLRDRALAHASPADLAEQNAALQPSPVTGSPPRNKRVRPAFACCRRPDRRCR